MKTFSIVIASAMLCSSWCYVAQGRVGGEHRPKKQSSNEAVEIKMIQGTPARAYSVISPISASKSNVEKAFAALKRKGNKLGADAVIQWDCDSERKVTPPGLARGGLFGLKRSTVDAACEGIAIKWK